MKNTTNYKVCRKCYNSPKIIPILVPNQRRIEKQFQCQYKSCSAIFTRYESYQIHMLNDHRCTGCRRFFARLGRHNCINTPQAGRGTDMTITLVKKYLVTDTVNLKDTLHGSVLLIFEGKINEQVSTFDKYVEFLYKDLHDILSYLLETLYSFKLAMNFFTILENSEKKITRHRTYISPSVIFTEQSLIFTNVQNIVKYLQSSADFASNQFGSGWTIKQINSCEIRVGKYEPIRPGLYIPFRKNTLQYRKYCWNVRTNKNDCFKLSVLSILLETELIKRFYPRNTTYNSLSSVQRQRLSRKIQNPVYFTPDIVKLADCKFLSKNPTLDQIEEFEAINDTSVLILQYSYSTNRLKIIRPTSYQRSRHVDLLLLTEKTKTSEINHFVAVRKLGKLFNIDRHYADVCRVCLLAIHSTDSHQCSALGKHKVKFPEKKYYEFNKEYMKMPISYLIFFKISTYFNPNPDVKISSELKYTKALGNLEAASFSIVVIGPDQKC